MSRLGSTLRGLVLLVVVLLPWLVFYLFGELGLPSFSLSQGDILWWRETFFDLMGSDESRVVYHVSALFVCALVAALMFGLPAVKGLLRRFPWLSDLYFDPKIDRVLLILIGLLFWFSAAIYVFERPFSAPPLSPEDTSYFGLNYPRAVWATLAYLLGGIDIGDLRTSGGKGHAAALIILNLLVCGFFLAAYKEKLERRLRHHQLKDKPAGLKLSGHAVVYGTSRLIKGLLAELNAGEYDADVVVVAPDLDGNVFVGLSRLYDRVWAVRGLLHDEHVSTIANVDTAASVVLMWEGDDDAEREHGESASETCRTVAAAGRGCPWERGASFATQRRQLLESIAHRVENRRIAYREVAAALLAVESLNPEVRTSLCGPLPCCPDLARDATLADRQGNQLCQIAGNVLDADDQIVSLSPSARIADAAPLDPHAESLLVELLSNDDLDILPTHPHVNINLYAVPLDELARSDSGTGRIRRATRRSTNALRRGLARLPFVRDDHRRPYLAIGFVTGEPSNTTDRPCTLVPRLLQLTREPPPDAQSLLLFGVHRPTVSEAWIAWQDALLRLHPLQIEKEDPTSPSAGGARAHDGRNDLDRIVDVAAWTAEARRRSPSPEATPPTRVVDFGDTSLQQHALRTLLGAETRRAVGGDASFAASPSARADLDMLARQLRRLRGPLLRRAPGRAISVAWSRLTLLRDLRGVRKQRWIAPLQVDALVNRVAKFWIATGASGRGALPPVLGVPWLHTSSCEQKARLFVAHHVQAGGCAKLFRAWLGEGPPFLSARAGAQRALVVPWRQAAGFPDVARVTSTDDGKGYCVLGVLRNCAPGAIGFGPWEIGDDGRVRWTRVAPGDRLVVVPYDD